MVENINGLYFAHWYGLTVPGEGELAACMCMMLKRRALCTVIEDMLVVLSLPTLSAVRRSTPPVCVVKLRVVTEQACLVTCSCDVSQISHTAL